jgi:hypothetical protein
LKTNIIRIQIRQKLTKDGNKKGLSTGKIKLKVINALSSYFRKAKISKAEGNKKDAKPNCREFKQREP